MKYELNILARDSKDTIIKKCNDALELANKEIEDLTNSKPDEELILPTESLKVDDIEISNLLEANADEKLGLFLGLVEGKSGRMVQDYELTENEDDVKRHLSQYKDIKTKIIPV